MHLAMHLVKQLAQHLAIHLVQHQGLLLGEVEREGELWDGVLVLEGVVVFEGVLCVGALCVGVERDGELLLLGLVRLGEL